MHHIKHLYFKELQYKTILKIFKKVLFKRYFSAFISNIFFHVKTKFHADSDMKHAFSL